MQGALVPPGTIAALPPALQAEITTVRVMANGFVVTSLLWAALLASLIDRRLIRAATFSAIAGFFTLFGVIHSPLVGNPVFLPWKLSETDFRITLSYATGYLGVAVLLFAWHFAVRATNALVEPDVDVDLHP
jgi:AGZA family xanthine/uracil permease-like MFS transporter